MNQLKFKKHKTLYLLVIFMVSLYSCAKSGDSSFSKRSKKKSSNILIEGEMAIKDESYTNIKGTSARLRALMCGSYVQYSGAINDGEDSVLTYVIPVGDHNKVGYWIFYTQCLTSLPNNPVYSVFYKLMEVDRDTILMTHYRIPKDFTVDIGVLLKNPKIIFDEVELSSLEENGFHTTYVRQTLIKFTGETDVLENFVSHDEDDDEKAKYKKFFFEIQPQYTHFGYILFDGKKNNMGRRRGSALLLKKAMVDPNYL